MYKWGWLDEETARECKDREQLGSAPGKVRKRLLARPSFRQHLQDRAHLLGWVLLPSVFFSVVAAVRWEKGLL